MQDKYTGETFDKAFVNDSWQNLRERLDQEMPTKKSPISKWLIILATTQIMSLIGLAYLLNDKNQRANYTELTREINTTETIYLSSKSLTNDQNTRFNFRNSTKSLTAPRIIYRNQDNQPAVQYIFTNLPTVKESSPQRREISLNKNKEIESIKKIYSTPDFDMHFAVDQTENSSRLPHSFFKNGLSLGLGLMTSTSFGSDYTGYGVLGSLNFKFNESVALSTGIGYSHISRKFLFAPFLGRASSNYLFGDTPLDLNKTNTYFKGLSEMRQIVVPFNLNFKLGEKLDLLTGMKFRYTFGYAFNHEFANSISTRKTSSLANPEQAYYNPVQFGLNLGFVYYPSESFSISMDAEFGINKLIHNLDVDRSSNGQSLGLLNLTGMYHF